MIKELLPPSIAEEDIAKLAEATEGVWQNLFNDANLAVIYAHINELPEPVLDLLAWQFHLEGYELAQSVEEKRQMVKSAIELHRHKGTPYAVKGVLEALGVEGQIKEWFEYGGQPYTFRVELGITNRQITPQLREKLIELINQYKNARSHLAEVLLAYLTKATCYAYAGTVAESYSNCEMITSVEEQSRARTHVRAGTMAEAYGYARFTTWQ